MRQDGGPAFPINLPGFGDNGAEGMSVRDCLAIAALQGMLAHARNGHGYRPRNPDQHWHDAIADEAYEIAEAMLRARSR